MDTRTTGRMGRVVSVVVEVVPDEPSVFQQSRDDDGNGCGVSEVFLDFLNR